MKGIITLKAKRSHVIFYMDDKPIAKIENPTDGELGAALLLLNLFANDLAFSEKDDFQAPNLSLHKTKNLTFLPKILETVERKLEIINFNKEEEDKKDAPV